MSPAWGHITGVITVVMMLVFIGIWVWAWQKGHVRTFQRMAQIPMEDPPEGPLPSLAGTNGKHTANTKEDGQP